MEINLEDLIALSRPEALDMLRQIEELQEDAFDEGLVTGIKLNDEPCVEFEKSSGCVFTDIDACGTDCCKVTTETK